MPYGTKGIVKFCWADGRAAARQVHHSMIADWGIGLHEMRLNFGG